MPVKIQITDKGEHGLRTMFQITVADLDASRRGEPGAGADGRSGAKGAKGAKPSR
jgi:hypothetical protein